MTNQEAYDLIFDWLARPGATKCVKIVEGETTCVYDNGEGNHCAIGGPMKDILSTKVRYTDEMWDDLAILDREESRLTTIGDFTGSIKDLLDVSAEVGNFWGDTDFDLLDSAQSAHDAPLNDETWQRNALEQLNTAAYDYKLELKEIPDYAQ